MNDEMKSADSHIRSLHEREKELECLYRIDEILNKPDADLEKVCYGIIGTIPSGWQYPDICQVKITIDSTSYHSPDFKETPWVQSSEIMVQDEKAGDISIYYSEEKPRIDDGPFLKDESRLLGTIANRFGNYIEHTRMKSSLDRYLAGKKEISTGGIEEWRVILDLLLQTDKNQFFGISQKMLYLLCLSGVPEAEELREKANMAVMRPDCKTLADENRPNQKQDLEISRGLSENIFNISTKYLTDEQIVSHIRKWIKYDKLSFMMHLSNRNLTLGDVIDAIRRYRDIAAEGFGLPPAMMRGIKVSLLWRFFSSQLDYINISKNYIDIKDFFDLLDRIIFTAESHGRLGGKSAGLFLASKIIQKSSDYSEKIGNVKIPKTWYITSDVVQTFIKFNNIDEVIEQKYKDINHVRLEYPHVIQTFKNSFFPLEIVQGLSMILDDFEGKPLVVRSSSLLEDSMGAAFSGKYKSLFIANQGSKQERLEALSDAIAEVYASTFGPDPIEYRAERGLLDFSEEMGIMIQEVVGKRAGDYFFPAFAGVALSRNEFRWSPRIKREDGLVRLVPGLGTRAVDRLSDDYPILIAPGKHGLRANATFEETVHYSPNKIDVINLKTRTFETLDVAYLLKKCGDDFPVIEKIVSTNDGHHLRKPHALGIDFEKDDLVVTFEGLIDDSPFVKQIKNTLELLENRLGTPVDIEFAHDGEDFYLLQCRPQSYSEDSAPVPIPKDVPEHRFIFSANRYISNGKVPDITHIVYIDPRSYSDLPDRVDLVAVGRAVGKLNRILPRRRFILMGPGRWGSRGDIKLGVNVTYSDISNTSALIEIARKKGNYVPDLSFGTHFFQDLVESRIRYLPLYPDDEGIVFNESFLLGAPNVLPDVLPEFAYLADVVRLIDLPKANNGMVLQVLMNAELNEAAGILTEPGYETKIPKSRVVEHESSGENYWAWRLRMSEYIASQLDPGRFGVEGFYVFGSTKNCLAGPKSDIDILIHFRGSEIQRRDLMHWMEAWSLCLDEMNYLKTGYRTGGLLDVHVVTDEDIANKTSYSVKIGAVTDAARPLPMKHD